jgi:transposase
MALHSHARDPVPEETQRVARAAFPHGNLSMQVAARLGNRYHAAQCAPLFPTRGQPAEAPARLALATVLQFAEALSDRQAADAVRRRIDWKYVLGLELTAPGFHHTVRREFRTRRGRGKAEQLGCNRALPKHVIRR